MKGNKFLQFVFQIRSELETDWLFVTPRFKRMGNSLTDNGNVGSLSRCG